MRGVLAIAFSLAPLGIDGAEARKKGEGEVRGTVTLASLSIGSHARDVQEVLVILEGLVSPLPPTKKPHQMTQSHRAFEPKTLVVSVGATVSFPNQDDELHNVFSLSPAGPFDLSLYEHGVSRDVTFTKPGIVSVFCNIHPQMRAHIIVVSNSYYVHPNASGEFELKGVPPGTYALAAWHPNAKTMRQEIKIDADRITEVSFVVREVALADKHLDKDGKRYTTYAH
jgi:plastocyanin